MTVNDSGRFESTFERHHRAVLAYALRRVPSEADAEDAVSETFAIAWRRFDQAPEPSAALPWLLAITRRVLANQHRSADRWSRLRVRLRAETRDQAVVHGTETPALEALERLPQDDRELLRLLAWEGLRQAEAGTVLGISENAVAIRLHRARKRFAVELARVKGSDPGRTSEGVEGMVPARQNPKEPAR